MPPRRPSRGSGRSVRARCALRRRPARTRTAWSWRRARLATAELHPARHAGAGCRGSIRRLRWRDGRDRFMGRLIRSVGATLHPREGARAAGGQRPKDNCNAMCADDRKAMVNVALPGPSAATADPSGSSRGERLDRRRQLAEMADDPVGAELGDRRFGVAEIDRHDRDAGGARGVDVGGRSRPP